MFRRKMRANYLPDMKQFQLQLYQLSRLVRDHIPDLYKWLDQNDVSPTLYAAPWILTIFSSQFPLGFVARVFGKLFMRITLRSTISQEKKSVFQSTDLLFLESSEVIFRVAIALLSQHKDELMRRDNFEEIMDYMKNTVPQIDATTLDKVMRDVFTTDIQKQLTEYQVEYNVLQEEISTTQHYMESLNREKESYSQVESKLQVNPSHNLQSISDSRWIKNAIFQFAESSIAQLEKTRSSQQSHIQTLQMQVQSLETSVETLGQFMLNLFETNSDIEIPGDVRRIVQQIGHLDSQRKKPIFIERKIGKSMSVNGQLGFPLKVLEELNESTEKENQQSPIKTKSPFFENTYMHLRKQNSRNRPNQLDANSMKSHLGSNDIIINNNNNDSVKPIVSDDEKKSDSGLDSGIATPLSPKENSITNIIETIPPADTTSLGLHHPFGNCEDVNFKYNGTTQLKSLRPLHLRTGIAPAAGTEKHIDSRS